MHNTHRRALALAGVLALSAVGAHAACDAPPPAVIDIDANSYYIDANHSIIDPKLKARNVANTKPVDDFLNHISAVASAYQAAPAAQAVDAACAVTWLAAWADSRAMMGKMTTEQSYYTRKWNLAGLALSYAKLREAASAAQRQAIEAWLRELADATIAHSEAHKGARNNHYYWEGLAVTAVGGLTKEARYLDWGRKVFDAGMAQVAADGSLPREMERAVKALSYHAFSVTPLVMIASILDVHSPKLDQLVQFTVANAKDPAAIDKATGFKQEAIGTGAMAWEVIYVRHEGQAHAGFAPVAPNRQPRLGGEIVLANPLEHVAKP
jgi:poly(beta-D-mannuronate) lyase